MITGYPSLPRVSYDLLVRPAHATFYDRNHPPLLRFSRPERTDNTDLRITLPTALNGSALFTATVDNVALPRDCGMICDHLRESLGPSFNSGHVCVRLTEQQCSTSSVSTQRRLTPLTPFSHLVPSGSRAPPFHQIIPLMVFDAPSSPALFLLASQDPLLIQALPRIALTVSTRDLGGTPHVNF